MSSLELDPALLETLGTLARHDVELVLVGDIAQAIHDDGGFVADIAIVPAAYARNAQRLSRALQALDGEPTNAPTAAATTPDWRERDLRELAPCTFATRWADVRIDFEPAGTAGYRDLFDDARSVELAPSVRLLVAAPEDLARLAGDAAPADRAPLAQDAAPADRPPLAHDAAPDVPYAQPPKALPPEPEGDELHDAIIRAARATRI